MERQCASLALAMFLSLPLAASAAELRPIVADGYDHDRWTTTAIDVVREFTGYVVSFDGKDDDSGDGQADILRSPEWVAQEIRRWDADEQACIPTAERPDSWITDRELFATGVAPADESYAYPVAFRRLRPEWFDRGHLAMKFLVERLGEDAGWNTHTVLNAVPQRASFNRGIWQSLEQLTGAWAQIYGAVWVIQGPVYYDREPLAWIGEDGERPVAVPEALFKIVARDRTETEQAMMPDEAGLPIVMAFLYPQIGPGYLGPSEDYRHERFLTSVDELEELTGLDFFTSLSRRDQARMERVRAEELWEPGVVELQNRELFVPACRD